WTFEAAEAVCVGDGIETADVLDLLTHLVEKSLVATDDEGGETRYRMLETVRQFGQEKLLESAEGGWLRTRHLDYFVKVAEQFDAQFFGPEQVTWLNR